MSLEHPPLVKLKRAAISLMLRAVVAGAVNARAVARKACTVEKLFMRA